MAAPVVSFDDLYPASGLAFGRAGGVGADGRLTGVLFLFFITVRGLPRA